VPQTAARRNRDPKRLNQPNLAYGEFFNMQRLKTEMPSSRNRTMSNKRSPESAKDQPMVYQIRLEGHLGDQWADWFGGMIITPEDNGNTLFTGSVIDQAALHGLLKKVRDLGMPLISVMQVDPK
jgi:glycerol kinase